MHDDVIVADDACTLCVAACHVLKVHDDPVSQPGQIGLNKGHRQQPVLQQRGAARVIERLLHPQPLLIPEQRHRAQRMLDHHNKGRPRRREPVLQQPHHAQVAGGLLKQHLLRDVM